MAFEDILKKISEDAQAEAESLLSLAQAEADAISQKEKRRADEVRSEMMQRAKERADEHASRLETLAGLELRKNVLKEKKILLEEAFAKAKEEIRSLPPNEYLAFLRPLIIRAVESGNEEIIPSSSHRHLFASDFLNSLNDELGPQKGHIRLSEESGDFSAGFVLRDGKKETNVTLSSLVESHRDDLEPLIALTLFGKGEERG